MGSFPISIFFGVDNMVKIKAKQIISGRVLKLFMNMLFSSAVSLSGAAIIFAALFYYESEWVKNIFLSFGESSFIIRAAVTALACLAGLCLFAFGKKRKAFYICRAVSFNQFPNSLKKTFSFLLFLSIKLLFTLCWGFVYLFPSAVCAAFLIMSLSQGAMEKNVFTAWISGCCVLLIIGIAFMFVTLQRYSAWKYYLCIEKNSVVSALYKSLEKTEGRCLEIALFKLSMLGWILSCALLLPAVYVLPYYSVSTALLILKGKQKEEALNEKNPPAVFEIIREH